MINYILQVILFQVLFLAIYDFFLSKETFFIKNRWYLLATPMLSFLIPFVKIPSFQKAVPQELIVQLPEIFLSPEKVIQNSITETTFYASVNYINILFWVGVAIFSVLFVIKLVKIINLIRTYEVVKQQDFTLILIPNQTQAFSFFNYVFLGKNIDESKRTKIIQHELVHSKQKHSLDLLFFEFLKIMMWFNPMIYFYQQRITLVHEYISDAIVAKSETKETYINNLLSNFFQVENISFINQFYKQSFIKKRIMMMTKTQSKKMNQLKYLVLIPMLASMFFYSSCSDNLSEEVVAKKELRKMYVSVNNGELKIVESKDNYSYFDLFIGVKIPEDFKKVSQNDLTNDEMNELENTLKGAIERGAKLTLEDYEIYQMKNGRKVMFLKLDPNEFNKDNSATEVEERKEVSFLKIDKAPTFPGCEAGDKDCFSKNIQQHFAMNFDANLMKTLGLEPGRKRVFIGFKIGADGNIVDIKARAPHEKIEKEVIRVMDLLPKVTPGEQEGKAVAVTYSIPFTLVVD
ncbi:M56 family metallopeptidase [uncultured Polaribacter sp.]|uniref:M56 family metallopeptidase n=1 Tax=uncultured Polaribacter sp. TaxID=174711 RepID=UPI0030D7B193